MWVLGSTASEIKVTNLENSRISWRKSSYSNAAADCIEISFGDNMATIRDSKNPKSFLNRIKGNGIR